MGCHQRGQRGPLCAPANAGQWLSAGGLHVVLLPSIEKGHETKVNVPKPLKEALWPQAQQNAHHFGQQA